MRRARLVFAATCILILASGCTAHYRQSMARYRAAEPVPFLQRTQEWASKAGADEGVAAAEKSPVAGLSEKDLPKEEDTFVTVTSHVLGVSAERIKARAELMRDTARVDSELAKGIAWEDLALDVAFMNSDVRAARERWKATLYQYSQADYLEGLLREYRTFTRYLDVPTGEPLQKEMAQNFVPSPGVVAMKGEMIREEARLDELEWERTLRDAVIETGTLFFDYQYQFRAAQATRENVTLLENLVKVVDDRYQAGISSQADLLKAQTELERQRNALKDFEARQRADAGQINAALTRPSETPLGPPRGAGIVYAAVTVDLLTKTALDGRQEVNMAKAKVGRTEVAIRMGEVMNRPPFSQGYSTFERGMMPEASAGMPNMPVGFRPSDVVRPRYAQAEAYLAEMRQRLQSEKQSLEGALAQTRGMSRMSVENVEIAHRKVTLIEQIVLPQSTSAYRIALDGYTAGDMSFLDLLDAERNLIMARLELEESRRDQDQTVLRLAGVRGSLGGATK